MHEEAIRLGSEPDLNKAYGCKYRELRNSLYLHNPLRTFNKRAVYTPILGTVLPQFSEVSSSFELAKLLYTEALQWTNPIVIRSKSSFDAAARRSWVRLHHPSWKEQDPGAPLHEQAYATLYYRLLKAIHRQDPIGIAYLPDEYGPEAQSILTHIREMRSREELHQLVLNVFFELFGPLTGSPIGKAHKYAAIAEHAWYLWERYRK